MADKQDKIYYVERILNKRNQGLNAEYYVKWMDYPASYNSWEPVGNFHPDLVERYNKQQEKKKARGERNLAKKKPTRRFEVPTGSPKRLTRSSAGRYQNRQDQSAAADGAQALLGKEKEAGQVMDREEVAVVGEAALPGPSQDVQMLSQLMPPPKLIPKRRKKVEVKDHKVKATGILASTGLKAEDIIGTQMINGLRTIMVKVKRFNKPKV